MGARSSSSLSDGGGGGRLLRRRDAGAGAASTTPSVTAIWPPTGSPRTGAGGRRLWPAVFVGALAANATTDVSYTAAGIAIGNTLEAVVGASLLAWAGVRPRSTGCGRVRPRGARRGHQHDGQRHDRRRQPQPRRLAVVGRPKDVAPVVARRSGRRPARHAGPARRRHALAVPSLPGRAVEAVALVAGSVAVGVTVFTNSTPLAYLTFPFYIWGRCDSRSRAQRSSA